MSDNNQENIKTILKLVGLGPLNGGWTFEQGIHQIWKSYGHQVNKEIIGGDDHTYTWEIQTSGNGDVPEEVIRRMWESRGNYKVKKIERKSDNIWIISCHSTYFEDIEAGITEMETGKLHVFENMNDFEEYLDD